MDKAEFEEVKVANTSQEWSRLLRETPVKFLLSLKKAPQEIYTLKNTATLKEAAEALASRKILSAPVFDFEKHIFLGFLDMIDIMGYVVSHWRSFSQKFDTEHFPSDSFFNDTVDKVVNFSKVDYPSVIPEKASIEDLLELFNHPVGSGRLHRVGVLKSPGALSGIISQSDIIAFIAQYYNVELKKGIQELGLGKIVVMAFADDPVNKVLELMYDHRISGIGLVDKQYRLVGNLSASDLRGKLPSSFDYFTMSAIQLSQHQTETGKLCAVFTTASLEDVLQKIVRERVHRAYIVSEEKYLIGVVTLTDIIRHVYGVSKSKN